MSNSKVSKKDYLKDLIISTTSSQNLDLLFEIAKEYASFNSNIKFIGLSRDRKHLEFLKINQTLALGTIESFTIDEFLLYELFSCAYDFAKMCSMDSYSGKKSKEEFINEKLDAMYTAMNSRTLLYFCKNNSFSKIEELFNY
jgi:hypothetical protein